jgi:hypothetical protein
MRKTLALISALFLVSGFAAAQGQPDTPDRSDQGPGQPDNVLPGMPDLPGQASETAGQVIGAIGDAFTGGVQGLGDRLGSTLSGLLSGNETAE